MLSMAQQIAPGYVGKLVEERGEKRRKESGIGEIEGDPETLKEVRAKSQELNATINVAIDLDVQAVANMLIQGLTGVSGGLVASVRREQETKAQAVLTGVQMQNAAKR